MRIPFKTLRFERGEGRIWGVNFSRRIRRKNEVDYWSPVPRVYNLYRAGLAGTLTGLPRRQPGTQPAAQAVGRGELDARPSAAARSTPASHAGLDVKYGVTPSLTLDVTVKPDFAQAEADEQQVNLTQFSLFFPEKREFFLENSGMFYFGDIPRESRLGNARFAPPEEEMLLFFSRRIGLTDTGQEIPIAAGGRLTGRVGGTGVGADDDSDAVRSAARDGDNYTVLRGRRDVLRNSDIGAIFLSRQSAGASTDRNQVAGVDANFRFVKALSINGFLAKSFDARRRRRPDGRQGLGRLERQLPPHAVLAAQRRRQLSRRHRVHQAARHPQALRRLRDPVPARVVAEVRGPRAAPAHALQHLHRPVEREGDAHQPRRDGVVLRARRLHRAPVEPALRAHHGAVQGSGPISRSRPAATAGTSTCWSWRPTTAGRCRDRR